jgi:hypothetical protein
MSLCDLRHAEMLHDILTQASRISLSEMQMSAKHAVLDPLGSNVPTIRITVP